MKTIKNGVQFIDHDCKIGVQGMTFTSEGAFILRNTKTNKLGGILYAYPMENKVGNWNGSIKVRAYLPVNGIPIWAISDNQCISHMKE